MPPSTSADELPESENASFPFAAQEQQEGMQQLAAVLSHHLGSLTSTISGYADLLVDTPSVQEQREIAMNVLEASTQIDDLLADLRYFSRPLQPVFRTVSVNTVVRDAVDLLDEDARARVQWTVEPTAVREIEADPRLLRQALLSLLHNGLEATAPAGSVQVRVARVEDDEVQGPAATAFDVWNEGEITLDNPADVFQPFFTTRAQSLGLGLSIASRIAEQHGGTLRLASNSSADGGTCFSLRV